MDNKLLLLSPEGEIRQAYHNLINKLGVQFDTVRTFKELYYAMSKVPYNGIMVDLNTKIRTPRKELAQVENILETFPVAELRWDKNTNKIGMFYQGQSKDGGNLEDFCESICKSFYARKISIEERININFNVILSKTKVFNEENVERTITINVSKGGCLIFSTGKWNMEDDAWFVIKDLKDQTPIRGEVRWVIEWGKCIKIPGIGVMYKEIKENQIEEISKIKQQESSKHR